MKWTTAEQPHRSEDGMAAHALDRHNPKLICKVTLFPNDPKPMQPVNHAFGGGASATFLHPLVAVGMVIAVLLILSQPRGKAITPFLVAYLTIPLAQVVVVGGVHFTMHQILILTVLGRMASFRRSSSEEKFAGGFNALDKVVVLWALLELIMLCLEWMETQALIKGLGDLVVTLGGYLAVRFLICDGKTVRRTVKALAAICVIQGVCMVSEQFTHQNVFNSAGANSPTIRNGHVRSEGAIGTLHGGTLAGVSIPLFLWLWTIRNCRMAAYAGLAGATAMVTASHASTSWLAYGATLVGLGFWPLRKRMRLIRLGLAAVLVGLHLVMNGPVWSLIEKIDLTGGSSSYHRYMLVDNCIRHFSDWWFIGYRYFGDWGFDMWDLCNQFVVAALTGGLVTLVVFIMIYSRGFGAIGTARKRVSGDRGQEWLLWCLGSVLFATVVASFGINYNTHLVLFWFSLLACVSVATFEAKQATGRRAETPAEEQFADAGSSTGDSPLVGETTHEWRHSVLRVQAPAITSYTSHAALVRESTPVEKIARPYDGNPMRKCLDLLDGGLYYVENGNSTRRLRMAFAWERRQLGGVI